MLAVHKEAHINSLRLGNGHYADKEAIASTQQSQILNSREYLLELTDPHEIAIKAAQCGDISVLEIILDPAPASAEEIQMREEYQSYLDQKTRLERLKAMRELQVQIIQSYYEKYGVDILKYRKKIEVTLNYKLNEQLQEFRKRHRESLLKKHEIIQNGKSIELNTEMRVKLHKQFSQQLEEEFQHDSYWVGKHKFVKMLKHVESLLQRRACTLHEIEQDLKYSGFKLNQDVVFHLLAYVSAVEIKTSSEQTKFSLPDDYKPWKPVEIHFDPFASFNYHGSLPLDLREAELEYKQLFKDIVKIHKAIEELTQESMAIINSVQKIDRARQETLEAHLNLKGQVLGTVISHVKPITLPQIRQLQNIFNFWVSVNFCDKNTGNNLLHFALENGQFDTALYLIDKKVDFKKKNLAGILAIDTQDSNGDTLLHYLVTNRKLKEACDFLVRGANSEILNHKQEHLLDLSNTALPLFHYLLKQLNGTHYRQEHLGLTLSLLSHYPKLSALLLKSAENKTAYTMILNLPLEPREQILDVISKGILSGEFTSDFQADINNDLREHFKHLNKQHFSSGMLKIISGFSEAPAELQLNFLNNLQKQLQAAAVSGSDIGLFRFIRDTLKTLKIPQKILSLYKMHLETVLKAHELAKRDPDKVNYYYNSTSSKKGKQKSSYASLAKEGISSGSEAGSNNDPGTSSSTYSSPLRRLTAAKKRKTSCADPLHWFDEKTPIKMNHF